MPHLWMDKFWGPYDLSRAFLSWLMKARPFSVVPSAVSGSMAFYREVSHGAGVCDVKSETEGFKEGILRSASMC